MQPWASSAYLYRLTTEARQSAIAALSENNKREIPSINGREISIRRAAGVEGGLTFLSKAQYRFHLRGTLHA